MYLSAFQIADFTGGSVLAEPRYDDSYACGISWDSREVAPRNLYVALIGERVDGHDFIPAALKAGAAGVLISHELPSEVEAQVRQAGAFAVMVDDTYKAVTDLARGWRDMLPATVIGLTGSSGKTTTKNLVRDVLQAKFKVVATKANQNNELGVPRTLLNANTDDDYVVVEMGMRGLNQISSLCEFVKPAMGIIVNMGESHIELLGGRDNIARAKGELFEALPDQTGIAFVNGADDYVDFVRQNARLAERGVLVCAFGLGFDPAPYERAVWAQDVTMDEQGATRFTLCAKGFGADAAGAAVQSIACSLSLQGLHNVSNATGAAAIGLTCGMTLEQIAGVLAQVEPESGRQEILKSSRGFTVVNDAYNANPESMRASLTTFATLKTSGRRIAVLGDMGELGSFAPACHAKVGALIPTLDIDYLVCVGELSAYIADAAREGGMAGDRIFQVDSVSSALECLDGICEPDDAILVKASHFMELNHVVEGLMG